MCQCSGIVSMHNMKNELARKFKCSLYMYLAVLRRVHNMTQDVALRCVSICEHPPLRLRRVA